MYCILPPIYPTIRRSFRRSDFKWKKYGGTVLLSEKTEALHVKFTERAQAVTSSYSQQQSIFKLELEDSQKRDSGTGVFLLILQNF